MLFKSLFKIASQVTAAGMLLFSAAIWADDLKPFQPFDLSTNKALTSGNTRFSNPDDFFQNSLNTNFNSTGFDFLTPQSNGYHLSKNDQGVFGNELVVGMKFADWLTLRLNVIENNDSLGLFSNINRLNNNPLNSAQSDSNLAGYQFGVSSVLSISNNWRLGFDLGRGRMGGELLGLYQGQLQTTSLGFGVRNQRFGATFQSDFMSSTTNQDLEQSTMDLQVDWHFTKEGTISFGARRSINENNTSTNIDQLTGTVPYIKFKHNL
ncbi:hypothetical protein MNBD_GAMMA02-1668 [hydrothermal vent metagenome]|uniref:Uncharacterized protein n=1 Tax=hydrothermal vent metagenome TaxID=652676 RepID=A0A3B0VWE0_9ZZZZ